MRHLLARCSLQSALPPARPRSCAGVLFPSVLKPSPARALAMSAAAVKPASRWKAERKDVWSIVGEAALASPVQPIVNMGQGFHSYNPPDFVINAAKSALDRVECNYYSHTRGRPRLRKAIADAYAPSFGRKIDPETEVVVTTGANEGILCVLMGFVEPGHEVIIFEPYFDQYTSNIEMAGGKVVYVPLHPPEDCASKTSSANQWRFDLDELKAAITPRTRMIIVNSPHNPVGKVFTRDELQQIADLCLKNNILILSDEVYDRLYYSEFTRMTTLSKEVEDITITAGSVGKNFYCTGWRVGYLIGPANLIKYSAIPHTRICFASPSPLQEAGAVAFEEAEKHDFWNQARDEMHSKVERFCSVFHELGLPYSIPEGGYFVLANFSKVKLPDNYDFPEEVLTRPRDYKMAWFLIMEIGVAAIPPSEFMTPPKKHLIEDYMRFAICKDDEILDRAKERLRGLKKYMS